MAMSRHASYSIHGLRSKRFTWCGRERMSVMTTYSDEVVLITCKTCLRVAAYWSRRVRPMSYCPYCPHLVHPGRCMHWVTLRNALIEDDCPCAGITKGF